VKRSDTDEPVWVTIYMCMEAMLGISLYSYPFSQTSKNAVFLITSYAFLQQSWRIRGQNRFCPEVRRAGAAQAMYIHVSKCKN
jgi:hypothetical protein